MQNSQCWHNNPNFSRKTLLLLLRPTGSSSSRTNPVATLIKSEQKKSSLTNIYVTASLAEGKSALVPPASFPFFI